MSDQTENRNRRAVRVAMEDQAEAASRDAADLLIANAHDRGEIAQQRDVGPVMDRFVDQLNNLVTDRIEAGAPITCSHVSDQTLATTFWNPGSTLLRCHTCAAAHAPESRNRSARCDGCGRILYELRLVSVLLDGGVVDEPGEPVLAFPPVIVGAQLCSTCHALDDPLRDA